MKNSTPNLALGQVLKFLALVDLVWALMVATLQSLILGQAGIAIGANGTATAVAAGASWISTFFIGLFQGGIFLFFACILAIGWLLAFDFLYEKAKPEAKLAIKKFFLTLVAIDLLWAIVQGVYAAAVIAGIGTASAIHASGAVVAAAAVLSFIVSAAIGLFTGTIFLTVVAGAIVVLASLIAFFRNRG